MRLSLPLVIALSIGFTDALAQSGAAANSGAAATGNNGASGAVAGAAATPNAAAAESKSVAVPATPAPKEPTVASETPAPEKTTSDTKREGVFGNFLVGPSIGLYLPVPLVFGLEARWAGWVGMSIESGSLPRRTLLDGSVTADTLRGTLRVFPWQESFFVGVAVGHQNISVAKSVTVQGQTVTANVDVSSPYVTPVIGWKWLWSSGFFWGLEAGWQIPRSPNVRVSTDANNAISSTAEYKKAENEARDAANKLGEMGLPHLAVINIGYLF